MIFNALRVSENKYQIIFTIAQLRAHNTYDPQIVDNATERDKQSNPALSIAAHHRGTNQRTWDKKRKARRDQYAAYIYNVENGGLGGYPPVTLWTTQEALYDPASNTLNVPSIAPIAATDGETQLSAVFKLAAAHPEWTDKDIAAVLYVKTDKTHADQMLHDMNHYVNPVSEKEMALHNHQGALTKEILKGLSNSGINPELINVRTDGLRKLKNGWKFRTSNQRILHGAVGAAFGDATFNTATRTLIEKANGQGYSLSSPETVANFIREMLMLPEAILTQWTKTFALAAGVYYANNGKLPSVPAESVLTMVTGKLSVSRGGKRAPIQELAKAYNAIL